MNFRSIQDSENRYVCCRCVRLAEVSKNMRPGRKSDEFAPEGSTVSVRNETGNLIAAGVRVMEIQRCVESSNRREASEQSA